MNSAYWAALFLLLITVAFYAAYMANMAQWVNMHESAHVQINKKFRVESTVTLTRVGGLTGYIGTTTNSTPGKMTAEEWEEVRALHLQNEIEGYNSKGIIQAIYLTMYLLTITISASISLLPARVKT